MAKPRPIMLGLLGAMAIIGAVSSAGCRGERSADRPRQFFPGMDDQPKYRPQSESTFFADGRSMREPVPGTVPFGRRDDVSDEWVSFDERRADFLREDDQLYRGMNPDGSYVDTIPVRAVLGLAENEPVSPAAMKQLIEIGQDRFNIFCIVCHGGTGKGDGLVGMQWATPIPSYHQPQYYPGGEKGQDGYLFNVIRHGLANAPGLQPELRMPAYGDRISEREAWAIVAYVRVLQETRRGELADAPEAQRNELMNSRGAVAPATGGGAE